MWDLHCTYKFVFITVLTIFQEIPKNVEISYVTGAQKPLHGSVYVLRRHHAVRIDGTYGYMYMCISMDMYMYCVHVLYMCARTSKVLIGLTCTLRLKCP